MTDWLRAEGHEVNVDRVRKLSRRPGLQSIYLRKRRSYVTHSLVSIKILHSVKLGETGVFTSASIIPSGCMRA